ncbi:MAG: toxin ParE1/3/4 [Phenylobacterium sp.]
MNVQYKIELTHFAHSDLLLIGEYYLSKAGAQVAQKILQNIEDAIDKLNFQPTRGHKPHELYDIANTNYLEIIANHHRIIYQIQSTTVYIIAIFDGRQDVKSHLLKRLTYIH